MDVISQLKNMQQELNKSPTVYAVSINFARKLAWVYSIADSVHYRGNKVLFFVSNCLINNNEAVEMLGWVKDAVLEQYQDGLVALYTLDELIKEYK